MAEALVTTGLTKPAPGEGSKSQVALGQQENEEWDLQVQCKKHPQVATDL